MSKTLKLQVRLVISLQIASEISRMLNQLEILSEIVHFIHRIKEMSLYNLDKHTDEIF